MAYDYRCTYCGKPLNQHTINVQMLPVLGETAEKEFKHFTFQVTAGEFRNILAQGTPVDEGYTRCKITFSQYMRYLSDPCNRNDLRIRDITYEQMVLFAKEDYEFEQPVEDDLFDDVSEDDDDINAFDMFDDDDELTPAKPAAAPVSAKSKAEQEAAQRKELEELFLSIFRSADNAEQADKRKRTKLLGDLRKEAISIKNAFDKNGVLDFDITLRDDLEDDHGERIFYGYKLRNPKTRQLRIYDQARTCSNPLCRNPVFEFAGSAEHKSIAFIGDQHAGKTSTLIALASYAERACQGGGIKGDPIWEGTPGIFGIGECRVIGKNEKYKADIERYNNGVGPEKTKFLKGLAYSITLRVSPRNSTKYKLLTLTDLPGELTGLRLESNTNEIYNDFPQALSCDAYILCYDARPEAINTRQNLMVALEKFQREHLSHRTSQGAQNAGRKQYIPTIVIFNKCVELEDPDYKLPNTAYVGNTDRVAAAHIFYQEMREIAQNAKFNDLCMGLRNGNETKYSYQTAIRIAPYGFKAPDPDTFIPGEIVRYPTPRNIDKLMYWLMAVTGCIPCTAEYIPDPSAPEIHYRVEDYTIDRLQCRIDIPSGGNADEEREEAAIRAYLFSNPNEEDIWMLENYDRNTATWLHRRGARTTIG